MDVLKFRKFVIGSVSLDRAVRETFAPPVFANACKRVLENWSDHDEVEEELLAGGKPAGLHKELRERVCNGAKRVCDGLGVSITVSGERLSIKGKEEQCSAEGGGKSEIEQLSRPWTTEMTNDK